MLIININDTLLKQFVLQYIVKAGAAPGLREHQPLETTGVFKEMLFSIRIFVNTTQMRRTLYLKNSRGNLALPTHLQRRAQGGEG